MNYGNNLFQLRERLGLTNIETGKIINISDSLYSRYEKEEQTIPIKHLNTLCNYFDVSLDYIFGFTKQKKYIYSKADLNLNKSSKRIKELRKEINLSQCKLADILKIDNSMLSKYEKGKYIISTPFLYDICKKYNVSADYLLGKIDEPKYLK